MINKYLGKINCTFVIARVTTWSEAIARLWDCFAVARNDTNHEGIPT
jgi:hypothetical protein